ncbi:MAG: GIY-YIG nuclease family protein [Planctomycetes bacterium]|nr:GIY-YIG nuclease family protein [Planctomycetota bacterium]
MNALVTREVVRTAFLKMHQGRSTEDVVIDDRLNSRFLGLCRASASDVSEFDLNWMLFNLRKSASLGPVVSLPVKRQKYDPYAHAAEIAARYVEDKHDTSIDRVLCDPALRREFDSSASQIVPDVDSYLLRKAALALRKKRKLRPELIKRVADWGTVVEKYSATELLEDLNLIPRTPGVYLFFDNTGYLYIGEAANLRTRVADHLDHSDRKALARYLWRQGHADLQVELHSFDRNSNGNLAKPRRAYESALIQSRNPRFNIQD